MPPSVDGGRATDSVASIVIKSRSRGHLSAANPNATGITMIPLIGGGHGECVDSRSRRRCLDAAESLGQGARAVAAGRDPRCPGEGWYEESRCHPPLVRPM